MFLTGGENPAPGRSHGPESTPAHAGRSHEYFNLFTIQTDAVPVLSFFFTLSKLHGCGEMFLN